jgi:hypothetical protein
MKDETSIQNSQAINTNRIWDWVEIFSDDPTIKFLLDILRSIPFGAPFINAHVDAIKQKIKDIRREKLRTLFSSLADGKLLLNEDIIKTNEFLFCYFSTIEAAFNTRTHEKIELLGDLLRNGVNTGIIWDDTDIYEEILKVLDELSSQELHFLVAFDNEKDMKADWTFQADFFEKTMGLSRQDYSSFLSRLNRSGCLSIASTVDGGQIVLRLSSLYRKLKELALERMQKDRE